MTVFDLYKPLRNKVAQLSYYDALRVIWGYSQYLQIKGFQIPDDIQVDPRFYEKALPQAWVSEWELEILAKEVIINSSVHSRKGYTLRDWKTFAEVINGLKDLENKIAGQYGSAETVLIELARIAHRQFCWQGNPPNAISIVRYYKIFDNEEINQITLDELGLSVQKIYLCGIAFLGLFKSRPTVQLPVQSNIEALPASDFEKFLTFVCLPFNCLKTILTAEQRYDNAYAYAYGSLRQYPLLQTKVDDTEVVICPLPTLLFWRITNGLFYDLIGNKNFATPFGKMFEKYVGEVLDKACDKSVFSVLGEHEYGPKKQRKHSVDWILDQGDAALFVECKAKRLSWDAKAALDDLEPLERDISYIADAVIQLYRTIVDYENDLYPHVPYKPERCVYPVVVTLENWHMLGDEMLRRLRTAVDERLKQSDLPTDAPLRLPYSIWAVEELEVGAQVVDAVGIDEFMMEKLTDKRMCTWTLHSFMSTKYNEHLPAKPLFNDEYEELCSQVIADGS